jgi:ABC-type transport system substrate-binding protein
MALVACGGPSSIDPDYPTQPTGKLVVAAATGADALLEQARLPGLFQVEPGCTPEFTPNAAESWSFSEGNTELRLKLADWATWENGSRILAKDWLAGLPTHDREVEAESSGDSTLIWHLPPDADSARQLARISAFRPVSGEGGHWKRDGMLLKSRGNTRLEQVELVELPGHEQLKALEEGRVQVALDLSPADAAELKEKDLPAVVRHTFDWTLDYLAWNLDSGQDALKNQALRHRLAAAIETKALVASYGVEGGDLYARPAVGSIPPSRCRAHNDAIVRIPYDPDIRLEGLRLSLIAREAQEELAQAIRLDLEDAGVQVELQFIAASDWSARLVARDWDGALVGIRPGLMVDFSIWETRSPLNIGGFSDEAIDQLIRLEQASAPLDLRLELQSRLYTLQPGVFLRWRERIVGVNMRVQNARINTVSPLDALENWWIRPDTH